MSTFEPQRLVHLDLKGAPPKVDFLEKLFPLLKKLGANGLLIEYEDSFPYTEQLKCLRSANAYSPQAVAKIIESAVNNDLTVVPLVQTFGHLEFVLKHVNMSDFREVNLYPNAICPSNPKTFQLVWAMVQQVVDLHLKNCVLKYFHIGCDEVWHLGCCQLCKGSAVSSKEDLFLGHVVRVAKVLGETYSLTPIIWDDMMRTTSSELIISHQLSKFVQPMVWHYPDANSFSLEESLWEKYSLLFPSIWIASAFKGASQIDQLVPPIEHHISNHVAWLDLIKKRELRVEGVALTGWSRFDHFMTLCELLPVALPSLALCLQTLQCQAFNQEAHAKASNILGFENNIALKIESDVTPSFPGSELYRLVGSLIEATSEYKALKNNISLKAAFSSYLLKNRGTNPLHIESFALKARLLLSTFEHLNSKLKHELNEIFFKETTEEWLQYYVSGPLEYLRTLMVNCEEQMLLKGFPSYRLSDENNLK